MVLRLSQRQLPGGAPATGDGVAVAASARFPVEVRVAVAPALAAYRADAWRHYAPFILLAALLAGYLAHLFRRRQVSWSATRISGPCAPVSSMVYQPIIHLDTGECRGVEALVRWQQADRSQVRTSSSLAKSNGTIGDLGTSSAWSPPTWRNWA